MTKFTTKKANEYTENHKNKVDKKFYPKFNFAAPVGWINDPNGVVVYNDELHLFYQHYPYGSVHGPMHWGHAKTKDGLNWEDLEVALAPDEPYDKDGVFSGSAIEKDGRLYLMYTGHIELDNGEIRQVQNIAFSDDGIHFEKYDNNPVISGDDVPEGSSIADFRDPKVFEKDGRYYAVIGSKTDDEKGQVLLYVSDDLLTWEFQSVILPYNKFLGDMVECPDLILFEEQDAFLLSAMNYTDKETGEYFPHISWLIEGKVYWDSHVFDVNSVRKIDGGFDYYAPQTALSATNPNEYTAIAWQQGWNRTLPTHDRDHNWAGQMTVPRVLKEEKGQITQYPSPKLMNNISTVSEAQNIDLEKSYQSEFTADYIQFTMDSIDQLKLTLKNNAESIVVGFDRENQVIEFSRKETIEITDSDGKLFDDISYSISLEDTPWNVKIFIDRSSIQIFVNNYYTLTSTFYTENLLDKLVLESSTSGTISDVKIGNFWSEDEGD